MFTLTDYLRRRRERKLWMWCMSQHNSLIGNMTYSLYSAQRKLNGEDVGCCYPRICDMYEWLTQRRERSATPLIGWLIDYIRDRRELSLRKWCIRLTTPSCNKAGCDIMDVVDWDNMYDCATLQSQERLWQACALSARKSYIRHRNKYQPFHHYHSST